MKLNYSNRKPEGIKLAAIVAKDLRKRIKPSNSKTDHASAIELSLEGKHLTDAGIQDLGPALAEALNPPPGQAVTRLHSLRLQGNDLTAKSLQWLAPAMTAAASDLEVLDLSSNSLGAEDDADVASWEAFLVSLESCSALKVLNFSGNDLSNCKSWEVFARIYLRQFQNVVTSWIKDERSFGDIQMSIDKARDDSMLSVRDTNVPRFQRLSISKDETTISNSATKTTAYGLPSIAQINLTETSLGDSAALFLSWTIERHRWLQEKVFHRTWDATQDGGAMVITTGNPKFTPSALKLLAHSETSGFRPQGTGELLGSRGSADDEVPKPSHGRKHSHTLPMGSRRISDASYGISSDASSPATPSVSPLEEIESLRKRAQRSVIEDHGLSRVHLWHAAIKLLGHVRYTLINDAPTTVAREHNNTVEQKKSSKLAPEPIQVPGPQPFKPDPLPTYAAKASGLLKPILTVTPPTPPATSSPQVFRLIGSSRLTRIISPTPSTEPGRGKITKVKPKPDVRRFVRPTRMAGALPDRACFAVLCYLADPLGLLSERQRQNVLKYGQDKQTLALEIEVLGKATSAQIWMVLDRMDCLMYDDAEAGET